MLRSVTATRYVTPLREGGSLPALVEADDDGLYVVKFRGAGQGPKVLIAELICGELGRRLGLPVPELVLIEVDAALGRNEPDGEIQDLVTASAGINLGLDFLPGALGFDPLNRPAIDPHMASAIVWFDAYITNVDRTPRNPNLLLWHRRLWLIDHGAALYVQHTWSDYQNRAMSPFSAIKDHVLLPRASSLRETDQHLAPQVTPTLIQSLVDAVPADWLSPEAAFADLAAQRQAYVDYLLRRIEAPRLFVEEAINARSQRI